MVCSRSRGVWSFRGGVVAGTYVVRLRPRAGYAVTTPAGGSLPADLAAGAVDDDNLFGVRRVG